MLVYDSLEQARMRLNNSTITVDDRAFYVSDCSQKKAAAKIMVHGSFYPLRPYPEDGTTPKMETFEIDDVRLNFRRFRLGYMNVSAATYGDPKALGGNAMFLSRDSVRQQIQGLTRRSIITDDGPAGGNLGEYPFFSSGFEDMLFDRYPDLSTAMERMSQGWTSVAISRQFALGTDKKYPGLTVLNYRGRTVGMALGKKFPHFVIGTSNEYLKEALTEAGFPFKVEEA